MRRGAGMVVAAVAALALAAGCGGDAEREDVESYIREVNQVQQELVVPLTQASAAFAEFTTDAKELAKLRPKLVEGERTVRRLQDRLGELEPPRAAEGLHERLEKLAGAQVELADELERATVYLPASAEALEPLEAAQKRVQRDIAAAKTPAAQAKAFETFVASLRRTLRGLRALDPPPVLEGVHKTQVQALDGVAESGSDLAEALRAGDRREEVPELVEEFVNAPLVARSRNAQQARIDAVKAYNRRVLRVRELAAAVERERLRLQEELR